MTPITRSAARTTLALAFSAGILLGGCGDDGDDTAASASATSSTAPDTSASDETTGPAEDEVVTVDLVDYDFEGLPESILAGTKLAIENGSSGEVHELVAFRIPDDEGRSVEELIALPEAELDPLFAGPPATVLIAPPGGEQVDAVGDGTLTEPGRYIVFCSIPTGADPEEFLSSMGGDGPPPTSPDDGPPHFTQGMYAELVVE